MTSFDLGGYVLGGFVAAALLAGCGTSDQNSMGGIPPAGGGAATAHTSAFAARSGDTNYKIVYNFAGGSDAANPYAGVVDAGGTLYGTTAAGGAYPCTGGSSYGCGTVYSVTPGGTEKILHDFGAGADGGNPRAALLDAGGTLYGTTVSGGSYACYGSYYSNCGTVFSITRKGTEKVLHSFSGYPTDGARPYAALIDVKGTLYGTTSLGGRGECYYSGEACGTVFSITKAGTETVLHGFAGHPDGGFPGAGTIDVKGTLYGTTFSGGKHSFGTVFRIATDGKERVLHSFGATGDGRNPDAPLIELQGVLYGTTSGGGAYACGSRAGCGTVFRLTTGGVETVLHSFGKRADGENPQASLIVLNGTLYGTTLGGGANRCGTNCRGGTIFSITPSGSEKVVHSFGAAGDGRQPHAGMIAIENTLYGTTVYGGAHDDGTVFALKP